MRKTLIAGNWKMNGLRADLGEIQAMGKGATPALRSRVDLLVCPPATLIFTAAAVCIGTGISIGAQDCHAKASGAHTGDLSAAMLFEAGAGAIIVGHSERRTDHAEKDAVVKAKAEAAMGQGMIAIICVGETRVEREAGKALAVVRRQIRGSVPAGARADQVVVAYEPVWAIGTGLTPTPADIAQMHADIRKTLKSVLAKGEAGKCRILYGGSVKPSNAAEILAIEDVDGALVGGASLKAADFLAIAHAA
ncbi:MAG: triose-phosphate isomerase [Methylobacterium sp.]|nr:triose-phosphate isomerase [Methylobacterium sp.]MCA3606967.1 triose-phosphate isomerase [Methylobacterium sp.]MCA3609405.1 triose-phosphate isomerase [Methylobacterium sp.]MCA3619309.1 triose-phosphate isomerase [Methylobacterium sp.]MCA3622281.1 triose-phosphate isomerase [Methylobacterium sp.]